MQRFVHKTKQGGGGSRWPVPPADTTQAQRQIDPLTDLIGWIRALEPARYRYAPWDTLMTLANRLPADYRRGKVNAILIQYYQTPDDAVLVSDLQTELLPALKEVEQSRLS